MNILITGAAGFIGSHLTEKLLKLGHSVTGIDNFDPFYPRDIKISNLEECVGHKSFTFIEGDILDIETLLDSHNSSFDIVIHLAAKAGVRPSIENPEEYIRNNIDGTHSVLQWMNKRNIKKLVFASSSSVYGNNKKIPFSEYDPVNSPISPYAFTKKSCELLNYTYHHLYGFSVINLRFFTVFGPRQRPDLAIHKFFNLIYDNKPITIYGDGTTSRDYTFIDDIINGIVSSANLIATSEKLFEIINLGNNKPVALKDLVKQIQSVAGRNAIITTLPLQEGDVDLTFADISYATGILKYNPSISMEEGLRHFKNWFEKRYVIS